MKLEAGPASKGLYGRRRGAAIAALVILLAMVNLSVIAASRGATHESESSLLRVQAARAFFAAESGAMASVRAMIVGDTGVAGAVVELGNAEYELVELPERGALGSLVVEGRSGAAIRRIQLLVE
ncbi:MAG: hypothetical protein AAGG07_12985 [Planctomycetota bacterium]